MSPDLQPPLDLPRLVMRRASVVVVLGLLCALWLGLARMRDAVDDELAGAQAVARLAERLSALPALADDRARQALQDWQDQGDLRHLRLQIVDASGAEILPPRSAVPLSLTMRAWSALGIALFAPAPPFTVRWALPRPSGPSWQVSLSGLPQSERVEGLTSLFDGLLVLAGLSALMLVVMHWNTRRAFAPLARLLQAIAGLERGPALPGRDGAADGPMLPAMPIAELETIAAALRRLDLALQEADRQRRRLAAQVLSLQEDERQRLARELHDEFGQRLTALRVNTAWLARQLQDTPALLPVVKDMATQCDFIQQDVRSLLTRLRPLATAADDGASEQATLDELVGQLQALIDDWQRTAGHATRYALVLRARSADGNDIPWPEASADQGLPRSSALAIYRISQEALTNAARHAAAGRVELSLSLRSAAGAPMLEWAVADDGSGQPAPTPVSVRGNGLAGIKDRLWVLGSDLRIDGVGPEGHGPGWRLSALIGLDDGDADPAGPAAPAASRGVAPGALR